MCEQCSKSNRPVCTTTIVSIPNRFGVLVQFQYILFILLISIRPLIHGDVTQNTQPDSTEDIEYLDYLLDMKVTSGSFLELDLEKSPASITIITEEDIRLSGARHLSELLEIYVPGFQYFYNKWNGTLWGMRGVSNDRNTKIIVLINGHKLNTQARDGFQAETVLGLMDDIERIEVLRGPAGLVYGSGAIAGIVNIVTKKQVKNGSSVSARFGLHGAQQADVLLSTVPGDNRTFTFSAGFRRDNGIGDHTSRIYGLGSWPFPFWVDDAVKTGVPSDGSFGSTDGNWRIAGDWTMNNLNLYCRLTHQVESTGGLFIYDPWPEIMGKPSATDPTRTVDGTIISPDDPFWSAVEPSRNSRLLFISHNFLFKASHSATIGVNDIESSISFDLNTTRTAFEHRIGYETDYTFRELGFIENSFGEKRFSANSIFHVKSIPRLQLAAGLEYRLDRIGDDLDGRNEFYMYPDRMVVADIDYHTLSFFSEGLYELTNFFDIHLGGRLDFHTRAIMMNPKAALLYHPNDRHTFKLIFQSASNNGSADNYEYNRWHYSNDGGLLKYPQFLSPFESPAGRSVNILQPAPSLSTLHSLKPEKVYTAELAYVGNPFQGFSVSPTITVGRVSNLFGWTQTLFRVVNAGNYNYFNADMDIVYEHNRFTIGANHTYQRPFATQPDKESIGYKIYTYDYENKPYDSISIEDGSWYYYPILSDSTTNVNLIKNSITADGKNFLNLSTNVTKFYCTYKPFERVSIHMNIRLFWGLPGRYPIYSKHSGYNYWHISDGFETFNFYDYLRKGVSKKINAGIHFTLPNDFNLSLFVYDLLGIDRPYDSDSRQYVINTLRWQQMYENTQNDLYSTDQRTFHLQLSKHF